MIKKGTDIGFDKFIVHPSGDWKTLIETFEVIRYNGVWIYEIKLEAHETIIRNRNIMI